MNYINNSKLLHCYFSNGMPILPYYHCVLISKINNISYASEMMNYLPIWRRVCNLMKSWKIISVKRKPILIFSSTLFNVKKEGVYFNYIHGYYYNLYKDDVMLLEDGDGNYNWRTYNSVPNLSSINSTLEFFSRIVAIILNKIKPLHRKDYEPFLSDFPQYLSAARMGTDDYFVRFYSILIKKLLDYVKPKCVIINCASYGHNMSVITYCAKQKGIKVIEPQHGVIRRGPAYGADEIIVNSLDYYRCMPDVLFAFGETWARNIDWKYEKYVVGSPYLNEYSTQDQIINPEYDFLMISQPMTGQQEIMKINFVKGLAKQFHEKKILFRIHPSENFEEQLKKYEDVENITISNSTSILYNDIKNSKYIVGWYSNCLYEALAFGKNPVVVDTQETRKSMEQDIGIWVKDPSEMTDENLKQKSIIDYNQYWADNFHERARYYIDKIIY